jgi:hypothetical protein
MEARAAKSVSFSVTNYIDKSKPDSKPIFVVELERDNLNKELSLKKFAEDFAKGPVKGVSFILDGFDKTIIKFCPNRVESESGRAFVSQALSLAVNKWDMPLSRYGSCIKMLDGYLEDQFPTDKDAYDAMYGKLKTKVERAYDGNAKAPKFTVEILKDAIFYDRDIEKFLKEFTNKGPAGVVLVSEGFDKLILSITPTVNFDTEDKLFRKAIALSNKVGISLLNIVDTLKKYDEYLKQYDLDNKSRKKFVAMEADHVRQADYA